MRVLTVAEMDYVAGGYYDGNPPDNPDGPDPDNPGPFPPIEDNRDLIEPEIGGGQGDNDEGGLTAITACAILTALGGDPAITAGICMHARDNETEGN
ncbi:MULTISPECIES: hypothetical protein [Alphaproteobacteria]|jgi:hypothetical protein|uniref:hypothetical protein n=1 Tax=Alphaproteobacteria TaxID=28211 RepID=UPI0025F65C0E|nr:hypothetical protein [Hyphomonas sp.]MDF1807678.1 hypothetical protein [Hyphomonas sp.]BDX00679.1 hypothetical protein MACH15_24310 [Maricaulis maris]